MTNQELLDKIDAAVDFAALRVDFPDIERVISRLDDGTQEVIFRMQGTDPDFHPAAALAAIDAVQMKDIPTPVKNTVTWKRYKRHAKQARRRKLYFAVFKRVKALINAAGISMRQLHKFIGEQLPPLHVEDE